MSSDSPSPEIELQPPLVTLHCPVCRAQQPLQEDCRRCHADLRLLVRALSRVDLLTAELTRAQQAGLESETELIKHELRQLSPRLLILQD